MRRKLTQQERLRAEAIERDMAAAPEATMQRRDFLQRTAYAARGGRRRGLASAEPADRRGGEARGARGTAPLPRQHADRPLRRADDGEPVLRPLLRMAAEGRRRAEPHVSGPRQRQRERRHAATRRHSEPPSGRAAAIPTPAIRGRPAVRSSAARAPTPVASRTASSRAKTTSSRSATTTRATSVSSTRRGASSRSTTASTAP